MKILIKNVSGNVTADSLAAVFSTYGQVTTSTIFSGAGNNDKNNKAFVTMPDEKEARNALEQLNGCFVDGRELLMESTPSGNPSPKQSYYKRIRSFLSPKEKTLSRFI